MDGVIIVDKPEGWTSHDVVARVRRVLREKRVGHTGTLDPFATGVLVVLVGRATRLAQFLSGAEKEYEATIRLGYATDTGDLTGAPRAGVGAPDCAALGRERIEAALATLRGDIEQVPPMYSAKKVQGRKLYELARRGEEVAREAVRVRVSEFEIVEGEGGEFLRPNADGTCDVRARVVCSAGTYVRALAESVGENLSAGAHLAALRRTRAGDFGLERALTPEALQKMFEAGAPASDFLIPPEAALPGLPARHLTNAEARRVAHGAAVPAPAPAWEDGARVLLFDERGALLAVAVYAAERGLLHPRVMLAAENKS
ncbi:MAG TPA: tRNA pseudouridine(55) synthase TruB [Pyrinomonadaceae bacterium]|nr:tRNA pseudouridine(55) synthase TruB [Pyrinomonadaceae bacterium]